ncbi:MAG: radical SAM protein [Burkholderiales bacterium]
MTAEFMIGVIDDAKTEFPNLAMVIFSGGECFMLKDELYKTITYATSVGLKTRCVTNGFWGARIDSATRIVDILGDAGLTECNISTGVDHQQWVPFQSVRNCAEQLTRSGIRTVITVEKDTAESRCWVEVTEDAELAALMNMSPGVLTLQCNTWMPFKADSAARGNSTNPSLEQGCGQLFSNFVVTPYREVAACCGLTFEHIPEMKLGTYSSGSIASRIDELADDFLKIWIHLDGPKNVVRAILGTSHAGIEGAVHICEACAILHQDPALREGLKKNYQRFVADVMGRFSVKNFLAATLAKGGVPIEVIKQSIKRLEVDNV